MASLAQQFTGLRCPPLSRSRLSDPFAPPHRRRQAPARPGPSKTVVSAVAISNARTRDRNELKHLFDDAYERCRTTPMEGVAFTRRESIAGHHTTWHAEKGQRTESIDRRLSVISIEYFPLTLLLVVTASRSPPVPLLRRSSVMLECSNFGHDCLLRRFHSLMLLLLFLYSYPISIAIAIRSLFN